MNLVPKVQPGVRRTMIQTRVHTYVGPRASCAPEVMGCLRMQKPTEGAPNGQSWNDVSEDLNSDGTGS